MPVLCPDCKYKLSESARTCPRCGKNFAPPPPPAQQSDAPDLAAPGQYAPTESVGPCPACKSRKTYDVIKQSSEQLGFAGQVGAKIGAKISGHGRLRCRDCGHLWDK